MGKPEIAVGESNGLESVTAIDFQTESEPSINHDE